MLAMLAWVLLAAPTHAFAMAQAAQVLVEANQEIKPGFKTYALFLICNPAWLEAPRQSGSQTAFLYRSFLNFGHAIGDDNLALWFWSSPTGTKTAIPLPENVDVARSARFCRAWRLKPSEGPHLVITSTYPNEKDLKPGLPKDSAVFQLGSMTNDQITRLLSKLTDQLLLTGRVEQPPGDSSQGQGQTPPSLPIPQPPPFWERLLTAVQGSINSFGCAWTFKIDAGAVKADLHACQSKPGQ
jgi:hypothetical protein